MLGGATLGLGTAAIASFAAAGTTTALMMLFIWAKVAPQEVGANTVFGTSGVVIVQAGPYTSIHC